MNDDPIARMVELQVRLLEAGMRWIAIARERGLGLASVQNRAIELGVSDDGLLELAAIWDATT